MTLTRHAAKRMQQRHLPPLIVDLLQHFGQIRYQHGATVGLLPVLLTPPSA